MVNPETFERAEAYRADMLSLNPKVLRIRNMLTHKAQPRTRFYFRF